MVMPPIKNARVAVREKWSNHMEFLCSCIGNSVGLGNLWRFPYVAYKNGGAAFLVPYVAINMLVGRPIYYLELLLGQFSSSGPLGAFRLSPMFQGNAFSMMWGAFITTIYYQVVLTYAFLYLFHSFKRPLCHGPTASSGGAPLQKAVTEGAQNTALVSGKVALITATAPYFMLGVMLLRGITLPGASIGLRYLLLPRWESLFDGRVWAAATEQVFYSLSIGTGGLVLYGSFQEFRADMHGSVRIICIMDFMTSAFASLVIFSVLGNLAHTLDVPVDEVVSAGPGLAFITYPEALALLTFPNVWSVLFFTMLFMLGIDSQMANCEFVIKSVQDLFPPLEGRREVATFLYCVTCFLIGLPLTTRAGLYILTILDNYLGALIVLFTCFGETLIVGWAYGMDRFCFDVAFMTGRCPSYYFLIGIKYVSPVVLGTFLVYTLATLPRSTVGDYVLPTWADGYGWVLALVGMAAVVIIAVARVIQCGSNWLKGPLEESGIAALYYPIDKDTRYVGGAFRSPMPRIPAIN
ncbi:hypothetical protein MRX96_029822 [Rhipicephalus microplus]